ncbi:hypothetical protein [Azospirillum baldaniorum]|nr:hypothetical protein [Azospirillum baldaniorum]
MVVYVLREGGSPTLSAAFSVVTITVVVTMRLAVDWLGRRLPAGIITWRG